MPLDGSVRVASCTNHTSFPVLREWQGGRVPERTWTLRRRENCVTHATDRILIYLSSISSQVTVPTEM